MNCTASRKQTTAVCADTRISASYLNKTHTGSKTVTL